MSFHVETRGGFDLKLFHAFNRLVARLRGAVGWCAMAYLFNRTAFIIHEEGYEDCIHTAQNPVSAWWGAFLFEWRDVGE